MYKISLIVLAICIPLLGFCQISIDTTNLVLPKNWDDTIKSTVIKSMADFPSGTQVAFAMLQNDSTSFVGIVNDGSSLKNTSLEDKVFQIGSISKVFTSALLSHAVEQGDLSLNTPVDSLIGYKLKNDAKISLLQLSNHTSGLNRMPSNFLFAQMKDPNNPYIHYNEEQLKEYLTKYMKEELNQTKSTYSNLGAGLLGYALSKKYKKTYGELLSEVIFTPLNMNSSSLDASKFKNRLIQGQNPEGKPTPNWEFDVLEGAGAILSTPRDLSIFAKAILNEEYSFLNQQIQQTAKVNDRISVGMGWHIIKTKDEKDYYWHNGGTQGFTSSLILDKKTKKVFLILSNVSAFHPKMGEIDRLNFELEKKM